MRAHAKAPTTDFENFFGFILWVNSATHFYASDGEIYFTYAKYIKVHT